MGNRPIIFIDTDDYPVFCDNRCANEKCSRHISQLYQYRGGAKISKLRDTEDCEGYISKWKKTHREIEQIKKEMKEAGIE